MHKNSSKRNGNEENYHSKKFQNHLLVGFTKFLNRILSSISKSYPQHVSQFFICLKRPGIFVQRIYQLKNFDMNLKGCYLGCLLL